MTRRLLFALFLCSFVAASASASDEDFILAAGQGDAAKAEQMLKSGVKVNEVRDDGTYSIQCVGETALIIASTRGDLRMVKLLLKYKADPNVTNEGYSALLYAAQEGHLEVVKALVEAGADVNREVDGFTALMMAEGGSFAEIARYLRSKGAK